MYLCLDTYGWKEREGGEGGRRRSGSITEQPVLLAHPDLSDLLQFIYSLTGAPTYCRPLCGFQCTHQLLLFRALFPEDKARSNYCNLWSKPEQCPRQIQLWHRIAAHLMIWGNLRLQLRLSELCQGEAETASPHFLCRKSITGPHYVFVY